MRLDKLHDLTTIASEVGHAPDHQKKQRQRAFEPFDSAQLQRFDTLSALQHVEEQLNLAVVLVQRSNGQKWQRTVGRRPAIRFIRCVAARAPHQLCRLRLMQSTPQRQAAQ